MSLTSIFQDIADAIRSKTGKSESIYPVDMASEIEGISSGTQNTKVTAGTTNKLVLSSNVYESEV
jgi:hypothetical protein